MSYTGLSERKIPVSLLIDIYLLDLELQRRLGFFVSIQQLRNVLEGSWRFKLIGDRVKLARNWRRCENCLKKNGRLWLKVNGVSLYLCLECACKLLRRGEVVVEA